MQIVRINNKTGEEVVIRETATREQFFELMKDSKKRYSNFLWANAHKLVFIAGRFTFRYDFLADFKI